MKTQPFLVTVSHAPHDADVIIELADGSTLPVSDCEVIDGDLVIKAGGKESGIAKHKKSKGKKAAEDLDL